MTLIATEDLIRNYQKQTSPTLKSQRETIIKPINPYFSDYNPFILQTLLLTHGLFQPDKVNEDNINEWITYDLWSLVDQQLKQLREEWQGPDVNLFVFPTDLDYKECSTSVQKGSGLSFVGHILLFLNHRADVSYISAVLAHEYSHSFRLRTVHKQQNLITLRDTLILEGIAEAITLEKYNISLLPQHKTNKDTLEKSFNKWVKPNLLIHTNHPLHRLIMYGGGQFDQRLGYKVGAYLVERWQTIHQMTIPDLLKQPTENFFVNGDERLF